MRDAGYETILNGGADATTLSDREEELLGWLKDYGATEPVFGQQRLLL